MVQNTEMATPLAMPPFFTGYPYQGKYCPPETRIWDNPIIKKLSKILKKKIFIKNEIQLQRIIKMRIRSM